MARTTQASVLGRATTQEEHDALLNHHIHQLRQKESAQARAKAAADEAKAKAQEPLDEANQAFTSAFNEAKADLGRSYTRKYLQLLLDGGKGDVREQVEEQRRLAHDKRVLGQPVFGFDSTGQGNLFDIGAETPNEARDALFWEADGYLAGRRALIATERKAPENCQPRWHSDWLKGYDRGTDENNKQFLAAQEAIARRGQPNTENDDANLNEEMTAEELDAAAKKVKASEFMDTKAGGEGDEAQPEAEPPVAEAA